MDLEDESDGFCPITTETIGPDLLSPTSLYPSTLDYRVISSFWQYK